MVYYFKGTSEYNLGVSVLSLALVLMSVFVPIAALNSAQAETGQGDDVFRVIMTIFGVDKTSGDVVAMVTVNNGEASKVRFLDSDIAAGTGGIIEYVATVSGLWKHLRI